MRRVRRARLVMLVTLTWGRNVTIRTRRRGAMERDLVERLNAAATRARVSNALRDSNGAPPSLRIYLGV